MDKIANVTVLRRKVMRLINDAKQCKSLTPMEVGYIRGLSRAVSLIDKLQPCEYTKDGSSPDTSKQ